MIKPEKCFCDLEYRALDNLQDVDVAVFSACHGTPYKPGTASHAANAPKQYDTHFHGTALTQNNLTVTL